MSKIASEGWLGNSVLSINFKVFAKGRWRWRCFSGPEHPSLGERSMYLTPGPGISHLPYCLHVLLADSPFAIP